MKFAKDVIELMQSYPGRQFRMIEIVRYVANGRRLALSERRSMRKGVLRVLESLAESGIVLIDPPRFHRGAPAFYAWRSDGN